MKIFLHVSFLFLWLFFGGCAVKKDIQRSDAYLVTIKNPSLAFSDTGFLNHGKDYTNVQIFSAGTLLFNLEMMGDYICLDGHCLSQTDFNKQFFYHEHYPELLHDILNKEPIYHGLALQKTSNGFVQDIEKEGMQIHYAAEGNTLLFRDTKNHILIRFKPLQ